MIESIAATAHEEYIEGQDLAQIDPASILALIEVITQIISMFGNCKKSPTEALAMSKNPTFLQKAVLNSVIRRECGRRDTKMADAVLKAGKRLEAQDIQAAYEELDLV